MARKPAVRYKVYDFIKVFKVEHDGNSPTLREMQEYFKWRSETTGVFHLKALVVEGKVVINDMGHIKLPGERYKAPPAHLLGAITGQKSEPITIKRRVNIRTPENIRRLYKAQQGMCWWCEDELLGIYEVDHIHPVAKGGSDDISNLCLSCPTCNSQKGSKSAEDFKNWRNR